MSKSMRNIGLKSDINNKSLNMTYGQKPLQVAVAVIKNSAGQVLISLRNKSLHQGGYWEFPGGKIELGETPIQALGRELKEELDITVVAVTPLINVAHQYPDLAVQLHVYLVENFLGVAKSSEGQPLLWVAVEDLTHYAFPAANQPIITAARLPPCYAILDDADDTVAMENLQKILNRGVKLIQLRLKRMSAEALKFFMVQACSLCKQHGALLLMNSAVKMTENDLVFNGLDAGFWETRMPWVDGIHLTSLHLMSARRRPENMPWLSASCHNLEELQHAQQIGVDFAVLAPVLATQSHPDANPLGWKHFRQLVSKAQLPVYALGGMTEATLSAAREAGGQGIAAIRAFL
jgi:8-oxo-dGTP diphosphatase